MCSPYWVETRWGLYNTRLEDNNNSCSRIDDSITRGDICTTPASKSNKRSIDWFHEEMLKLEEYDILGKKPYIHSSEKFLLQLLAVTPELIEILQKTLYIRSADLFPPIHAITTPNSSWRNWTPEKILWIWCNLWLVLVLSKKNLIFISKKFLMTWQMMF